MNQVEKIQTTGHNGASTVYPYFFSYVSNNFFFLLLYRSVDSSQEIIISGINQPNINDGTVSINLNDTQGPFILSSSTPIITFDEENPTITVTVDNQELQGKEPEERKMITKARIEEALRQIVVTSRKNFQPEIPDDNSIAKIIANTVSDFLQESREEIPEEILVYLETETDLDVPEIEIGHNEDDGTFTTTVKLPGDQQQSIEFSVPVPKSSDKQSVDVDALSEVISVTFDNLLATSTTPKVPSSITTSKTPSSTTPSLSDKLGESVSIAQIISQSVDAYVKESKEETPEQLLIGIETIPDLTNPQIQVEPTLQKNTIKAAVKLPGEVEQSIEFLVPVNKSPVDESIDIENLAEGISKTFDKAIGASSGLAITEDSSVPEIIANIVTSYVEQSKEDVPRNLFVEIESKGNLKNPEIQVEPTKLKGTVMATVHLPSSETGSTVKFKVKVPTTESTDGKIDTQGLAEVISETYDNTISKAIIDGMINGEANLPETIAKTVEVYVENSGTKSPDNLQIIIETNPNIRNPEIQVQPTKEGPLKTTINVPGPAGSPVNFQVPIPKLPNSSNLIDDEKLAESISNKYEETVGNKKEAVVPKEISMAIVDFVKESEAGTPDNVHVTVEAIKNLSDSDISIGLGVEESSLDAKIKLPGIIDKTVKFEVPIPKISNDKDEIDMDALTDVLSKTFDEARYPSPTSPFIDELANGNGEEISLSDVIANTVAAYVDKDPINTPSNNGILGVKVETKKDLQNPEIEVKPGQKGTTIDTAVKIPGPNDMSVDFKVPISLTSTKPSVNVKQLSEAITNGFDSAVTTTTTNPIIFSSNEDISEMVTKSVMDHLKENNLSHPDDVTVVVEPNSDLLEPKITVDGINEIEINVQIPKIIPLNITERIIVPKVPGTDTIDVQKFNSAVKEVIDLSDKPESSSEIATIMSTIISGMIIDENDGSLPTNIRLQINFNDNKNVAEIESVTSEKGSVIATVTVPGKRDEPSRIINIPTSVKNSSNIDKNELIKELSTKIEPLLKPTSNDDNLIDGLANRIADAIIRLAIIETILESTPSTATIELTDGTNPSIKVQNSNTDASIGMTVVAPTSREDTTIKVDIPKIDGSNQIDREELIDNIENTLKANGLTTTTAKSPENFSMSIDQFGFTIATLSETDVTTTTTKKSTLFDDNNEEKSSTEMADFMSVSEFGFTISAPVSEDDSRVANGRPENQGAFSDFYLIYFDNCSHSLMFL